MLKRYEEMNTWIIRRQLWQYPLILLRGERNMIECCLSRAARKDACMIVRSSAIGSRHALLMIWGRCYHICCETPRKTGEKIYVPFPYAIVSLGWGEEHVFAVRVSFADVEAIPLWEQRGLYRFFYALETRNGGDGG